MSKPRRIRSATVLSITTTRVRVGYYGASGKQIADETFDVPDTHHDPVQGTHGYIQRTRHYSVMSVTGLIPSPPGYRRIVTGHWPVYPTPAPVGPGQGLANANWRAVGRLTGAERVRFFDAFTAEWCRSCGMRTGGAVCHCENDE